MKKVEEITDKGDRYAKRMLVRKRELNQSPECYSKSLRRRLSIMEAINKNSQIPSSGLHYDGNPFEREFANSSGISEVMERRQAKISSPNSYIDSVSTSADDLPSTHRQTYSVESPDSQKEATTEPDNELSCQSDLCEKTHAEIDDNYNSIEYCNSSQFQNELIEEARRKHNNEDSDDFNIIGHMPRTSMGEYFASSTHKDLNMRDFANESKSFEEEFKRGNAQFERQGADVFFGARVLEILEPEVVNIEPKSSLGPLTTAAIRRRASEMALVQENFRELQLEEDPVNVSTTISFASEDIREIDREIDKLQFQPDVLEYVEMREKSQPIISETPRCKIYPNLDLVRRMSDNFSPKKLFHTALAEKTNQTNDLFVDCPEPANHDTANACGKQVKPSKPVPEDNIPLYRPPMPMIPSAPSHQESNVEYTNIQHYRDLQENSSKITSPLKHQGRSFCIENLELPKNGYCKPNLESTRKIFNSGGKTLSPISNMGSMISTLTLPNTPSSPPEAYECITAIRKPQQLYGHMGALPFEVENFLELALGEEHYNSSVTYAYSEMRDRTDSHLNASELISEDRSPLKSRKTKRTPASEPSKNRSKLDRTLTIYKTLTQRIKKKFRGSVKASDPSLEHSRELLPKVNPREVKDNVKKLLAEVDIQQTLIYQASKALELCNSMRAFVTSPERVESERLLILAMLRKRAAQEEISRLSSQSSDKGLYCERGEILLKELSLQLREDVLRRERQGGDIAEWFICVVSEGLTVWATQAVECPTSSPRLYFPGQLSIPGLPPDFRLTLTIYSLKMPKQMVFNHEDKYRIQNKKSNGIGQRSSTCPSPKTLLGRSEKRRTLISPKQHEIRFSGIQKSSFVVCGNVDLMLHDLNLKSPWPLTGVCPKSVLQGTLDLGLSCRLELSVSHAGFLTHGDEPGGLAAWNRRWCVLEGHSLLFWNYPREQECKPPLYTIDLVNCVSRRIGLIDRSLCAKPRTLLIETARNRNAIDRDSILVECRSTFTVIRNLLSCDTNQDLTEWQSKLNHVVSALREWSVIDTKLDS